MNIRKIEDNEIMIGIGKETNNIENITILEKEKYHEEITNSTNETINKVTEAYYKHTVQIHEQLKEINNEIIELNNILDKEKTNYKNYIKEMHKYKIYILEVTNNNLEIIKTENIKNLTKGEIL